jgi:lipopolysaccharide export system protein LptA
MIRLLATWGFLAGLTSALVAGPVTQPSLGQTKKTPPPSRPRASAAPAIKPREDPKNQPITVDADRMESLKREGLIIFTGSVVARQDRSTQYADRMEVYLNEKGDKIIRSVSTGNVRIVTKDCRIGTARRAEYDDAEQRIVLIENARVWEEDNVVTGERITIHLAEDRSVVQGGSQSRVKAVFYPKDDKREGAKPSQADCK